MEVLRADGDNAVPLAPQPTLADPGELVDASGDPPDTAARAMSDPIRVLIADDE
ncbi:hypothetical protein [Actinomadura sp. B10D3]|uniref:hypothetical protein n=1 Tax=Actinomadura sp. B10D3 TaxID=3153557 RepID=UPI00325DD58F